MTLLHIWDILKTLKSNLLDLVTFDTVGPSQVGIDLAHNGSEANFYFSWYEV